MENGDFCKKLLTGSWTEDDEDFLQHSLLQHLTFQWISFERWRKNGFAWISPELKFQGVIQGQILIRFNYKMCGVLNVYPDYILNFYYLGWFGEFRPPQPNTGLSNAQRTNSSNGSDGNDYLNEIMDPHQPNPMTLSDRYNGDDYPNRTTTAQAHWTPTASLWWRK